MIKKIGKDVKDLIFSGHVELAHLLLEQGANVENRTKKGYTPFFLASKEVWPLSSER